MNLNYKVRKNFAANTLSVIVTLALGIVIPRLTLTSYGSEINGLVNSVTQIYAYFTLFEAGVAATTLQALYGSVARESHSEINAILAATNRLYKRTGIIYLASIMLLAGIYPLVLDTAVPTLTIRLIIIVNGLGAVIQYFFQSKYFILLQAEGKGYVKVFLSMLTNVLKSVAKIVLMQIGCGVVLVQSISLVVTIIHMVYIFFYIRKNYAWIDLSVKPNFSAISQSKNSMVHQVSELIFNNTDVLILTFFCGLKTVSVYAMYKLLLDLLKEILSIIPGSVIFLMGQEFNRDRKAFLRMYESFETYYLMLVFAVFTVGQIFIIPFLRLYTSGVNDITYIDKYLPYLFIVSYLLSAGRTAPSQPVGFAGHFKLTQWRAVLEAVINLVASLIAVNFFGIYGVLIGTIAALFYRTNDLIIYSNRKVLFRRAWKSYRRWLINFGLYVVIAFVSNRISLIFNSYAKLFMVCIPVSIIIFLLYFVVTSLIEKEVFRNTRDEFKAFIGVHKR